MTTQASPVFSGPSALVATGPSQVRATEVAALAGGGHVIVWQSNDQAPDGSGPGIFGQVVGADRLPVGAPFLVNTTTQNAQRDPDVAGLPGGGFVVVWETQGPDGAGGSVFSIRAQVYDAAGLPSGGELILDGPQATRVENPSVAALPDGSFAASWFEGSAHVVFGLFDGAGQPIVPPAQTDQAIGTVVGVSQSLASAADGQSLAVVWEESTDVAGFDDPKIRIFDADGTPRTGPINLFLSPNTNDKNVTVEALRGGAGGYVATWSSADANSTTLFAQMVNEDGSLRGARIAVQTFAFQSGTTPSATALDDGSFLVIWRDNSPFSGTGVWAQRIAANGEFFGPQVLLSDNDASDFSFPSVDVLEDGTLVAVWSRGAAEVRERLFTLVRDSAPGDVTTALTLAEGGTRTDCIDHALDGDWVAVTLVAGETYAFTLDAAATGGLANPLVILHGAGGGELARNDNATPGTLDARLEFTAAVSGTFFVEAADAGRGTGEYALGFSRIDDRTDTVANAELVLPGDGATGTIETAGDADMFRTVFRRGNVYEIALEGTAGGGGTLADPVLRVLSGASGQIVDATDDDGGAGLDSHLRFEATKSGVFFLEASAFAGTGSYTLSVTDLGADTIAGNRTSRETLVPGTAERSRIDTDGDQDWFRFTLARDGTVAFTLGGDPGSSDPLADPRITGLYTAQGRLIPGTAVNDSEGSLTAELVQALDAGTYFVGVAGTGDGTGDYVLTSRLGAPPAVTRDDFGETPAGAGVIAVDRSVTGSIETARDEDWFGVVLQARTTYEITLTGFGLRGEAPLSAPDFIGVHDRLGRAIAGTDGGPAPGGGETLLFTPTATARYFLSAGGLNLETGGYRLTLREEPAPSADEAADATTRAILPVGATRGFAFERDGDEDWIRVDLDAGKLYRVTVAGVPNPLVKGLVNPGGLVNDPEGPSERSAGGMERTFVAEEDGLHFLQLAALPGSAGAYSVTIEEVARGGGGADAPRLLSNPGAGGEIATDQDITLTFSESVAAGRGQIVLIGGGDRIVADAAFEGARVTLDPRADLDAGTVYRIQIPDTAITDLGGTPLARDLSLTVRTEAAGAPAGDDWTLMVYVAADNDLEEAALANLQAMVRAQFGPEVNVVALVDRAEGFAADTGSWGSTARMGEIVRDARGNLLRSFTDATDIGEVNTGDADTLTQFIDWGAANFAARNYGLIVWDHGLGTRGTSIDYEANDALTLAEMSAAIRASSLRSFDLVGFDACYMATVEQASELRGLADVMVASQAVEPASGWDYGAILDALGDNSRLSAADLAGEIVQSYGDAYRGEADRTLSALDMRFVPALEAALGAFADRIAAEAAADGKVLEAVKDAARSALAFGDGDTLRFADIGDFVSSVAALSGSAALRVAARRVDTALDRAVTDETSTAPGTTGLGVFLPLEGDSAQAGYDDTAFRFLTRVGWDGLIDSLA